MSHQVLLAASAKKELEALPKMVVQRIVEALEDLADDPRPHGSKKLKGEENLYRIRVGSYRVIYEIHDKKLLVLVIRIRDRKDAY